MSGEISYQQIFSNISGVPIDYRDIDFLTDDFFSVCDKELFKREYQSFQKATDVDQRSTVRYIPLSTTDKSQYFVLKGEKNERLNVSLTLKTKRDILEELHLNTTFSPDEEKIVFQVMDYLLDFSKWIYDIETSFLKIYTTAIEKRQKLGSFYTTAWLGYYYILINPNIRNMLFKSDGSFQDGITTQIYGKVETVLKQISNKIPNKLTGMKPQYSDAIKRFSKLNSLRILPNAKVPKEKLQRVNEFSDKCRETIEKSETSDEEADKIYAHFNEVIEIFKAEKPNEAMQKLEDYIKQL